MAADTPPRYSVVIPTCARHEALARCLEHVDAARRGLAAEVEVIVSDDEAAPGARAILGARFPWVQWVEGPRRGPAANRNHGAAHARADWLVFTDDDCEPQAGWLLGFEAGRAARPEMRVLEGRTSAGAVIGALEEAPVNECGGFLWSCNFAIERALYGRIGGFDERFPFPRLEDVELRERLRDFQEPMLYLPEAVVIHPPRPLRPVTSHVRQNESYFYYAQKRGVSVAAAGLNPRTLAVTWRDRFRAARTAAEKVASLRRALLELLLLTRFVPGWCWKYRHRTLQHRLSPESYVRRPLPDPAWPPSWSESYRYDREEVFGEVRCLGYTLAYRERRQAALDLIAAHLPPGSRVLDLGAAQGNFSLALAARGYDVTWNDLRAELEGYVRLKHVQGKIAYAPGNVFELEFPEAFDAVLMTEIIEHVAHPDEFFVKVAALVRPGGLVVLTTPNGAYFRNNLPRFGDCADPSVYEAGQFKPNADGHIFLLHPDELETLGARAGLKLRTLRFVTNPLTNGHFKTERLLRLLPAWFVAGLERLLRRLPRPISSRLLIHTVASLDRR